MSAESNNFGSLDHWILRLVMMRVCNSQVGPLPFHLITWQAHHVGKVRFHSVCRLNPAHAIDRFTSLLDDVLKVLNVVDLDICHLGLYIFSVHQHVGDTWDNLRVFSWTEFVRGLVKLRNDVLITLRGCSLLFTKQNVLLAPVLNLCELVFRNVEAISFTSKVIKI